MSSKHNLKTHKCRFPTLSLADRIVSLGANAVRMHALGSKAAVHDPEATAERHATLVAEDAVPPPPAALAAFAAARPPSRSGRYRKPVGAAGERHSPTHIEWLTGCFMDGARNKQLRRTAEKAQEEMRGVRDAATNRRVFSVRSAYVLALHRSSLPPPLQCAC